MQLVPRRALVTHGQCSRTAAMPSLLDQPISYPRCSHSLREQDVPISVNVYFISMEGGDLLSQKNSAAPKRSSRAEWPHSATSTWRAVPFIYPKISAMPGKTQAATHHRQGWGNRGGGLCWLLPRPAWGGPHRGLGGRPSASFGGSSQQGWLPVVAGAARRGLVPSGAHEPLLEPRRRRETWGEGSQCSVRPWSWRPRLPPRPPAAPAARLRAWRALGRASVDKGDQAGASAFLHFRKFINNLSFPLLIILPFGRGQHPWEGGRGPRLPTAVTLSALTSLPIRKERQMQPSSR